MSDAEGRYIPIVEDDQGEGFKDEIPLGVLDQLGLEETSYKERIDQKMKELEEKLQKISG